MKYLIQYIILSIAGICALNAQSSKNDAYELTGSSPMCYQSNTAFYYTVSSDPISCPPSLGASREFWVKFTASTNTVNVNGYRNFSNSFSLQMTTDVGTELLCSKGAISSGSSNATVNKNVTGLSIGSLYYIRVVSDGLGPDNFNLCVTPISIPDAPTNAVATAGFKKATVSFTPPSGTVASYTVTANPGSTTGTGTSSPINVNGLIPGTEYTFTVKATNIAGTSSSSSSSNAVTPTDVPGTPQDVIATAQDASAVVTFNAPVNDGGLAVTSYEVTSSPENIVATGTSPLTVTGLTNGTSYTFSVKAINANGKSLANTSNAVTPSIANAIIDNNNFETLVLINELSDDYFTISSQSLLQAFVVDSKGTLMENFGVENTQSFGQYYPQGIYFLKLTDGKQTKTVRLLKL